jgi:hypothetical protein
MNWKFWREITFGCLPSTSEGNEKTKSEESVQGIIATGHYPEPIEYNPQIYTPFFYQSSPTEAL